MRLLFTVFTSIILFSSPLAAQVAGDYRTTQDGNWNNPGIWERHNGTGWVAAVASPTNADNLITIEAGHEVTIPTGFSLSVDQLLIVESLIIAAGGQLTLTDGPGIDLTVTTASSNLTVSGNFIRQNSTTISNAFDAGRIQFASGSQFFHNYTVSVGDLPSATWDPESTLLLQAFTNTTAITANITWDQVFGNIVFNATGQRALIDFAGNVKTIRGNLSILSTGNNVLQFSTNQNPTITIGDEGTEVGGDFIVSGTSRYNLATTGNPAVTIYGDWTHTSTNGTGSNLTLTGTCTVDLFGDFLMNAGSGRLHMAGAGTTGTTTINFYQNFTLQSGRIDELGNEPTQANFRFVANGLQSFVNTGTIAGHFNYFISNTSELDLSIYPIVGVSPSTFTLEGTVILGSLDALGALQTVTIRGNIRTPNAFRTFASGSTVIYRGAGPQFMGNGQPQIAGVTTIIDNADGVQLAANPTVNGVIRLESGTLNLGNFRLISGGSLEVAGGMLGGTPLSNLVIQGTAGGDWGTMVFDPAADTLGFLTLNRTGADAGVSLNSSLNIVSQFNLTNGDFNNITGLGMVNGAIITRYNTSNLIGPSPTISSGTYDVYYRSFSPADFDAGPELPADDTSLGNLTFNAATGTDAINLTQDITVNGIVTLARGTIRANTFNITMQGPTWSDNTGNFDPGTGTVIFNDTTVVGGTTGPLFGNIQLTTLSSLEFARSFTITGNIDFAAGSAFNMSNFTATLSGSNFQTISANGASFSNISIAKTANLQLTSTLNLTGILQFITPSSGVNLNSNGFLTVVSATDSPGGGTAIIYRLQNNNTVSGDVTVQRYMSGEGKIYRYLSSPVTNAMVSDWQDDFLIQGDFQDPSPTTVICGVKALSTSTNMYYYDETVAGDINSGYVAYPLQGDAATSSPLVVGRGYSAYIRRCTTPTVVDVTGPINQGQISIPVTYTAGNAEAVGWNLVGNPYPATIDWDLTGGAGWTKTRISPIISVMDNGTGMMRYYDPGVTNELLNGQLAIGQAFWVRATGAAPALTIREGVKVNTSAEYYRERIPDVSSFALSLSDGELQDRAYVKLHTEAKATIDDYDAPKILNTTFSFSTLSEDNVPMAINAYQSFACNTELAVGMKGVKAGSYQINLEAKGHFTGYRFTLVDHFLNREMELGNGTYTFEVTSNKLSHAFNRFSLRVEELLPDVNIVASLPQEICGQSTSSALLSSTEKDIHYSLWTTDGKRLTDDVTGTGEAMTISLNADSLVMGKNIVTIQAKRYCTQLPFATSFEVMKESPMVTGVSSTQQCQSGSVDLSASSNQATGNFYWYERETGGDPIYTGAEFKTPVLNKAKTYYVSAVSAGGECISSRTPVLANVVAFDPVAIDVAESILTSSYSEGNQWYFNSQPIEGANSPTVLLTSSGNYEVVVTIDGCQTTASFEFMAEETIDNWVGIKAYPNPVLTDLKVEIINEEVEKIEFVTLTGQLLTAIDARTQREHTVDLSTMADGTYLMIVTKNKSKQGYRIQKRSK